MSDVLTTSTGWPARSACAPSTWISSDVPVASDALDGPFQAGQHGLGAGAVDQQQDVRVVDVRVLEALLPERADPRFVQLQAGDRAGQIVAQSGHQRDKERRLQVELVVGQIEHALALQCRQRFRIFDLHAAHEALHQRQGQVLHQRRPGLQAIVPEVEHALQVEIFGCRIRRGVTGDPAVLGSLERSRRRC